MIKSAIVFKLIYAVFVTGIVLASNCNISVQTKLMSKNASDRFRLLFFSFVFALFAAIRPFEISDTQTYYQYYTMVGSPREYLGSLFVVGIRWNHLETGFVFFMAICKGLHVSFRGFLFIVPLLNTTITITAIKLISVKIIESKSEGNAIEREKKEYAYGLRIIVSFLSVYAFHYCCIAIRAGLSISIGMMAVCLLLSNHIVCGVLMLLVAIKMHSMAILFLLVYFLIIVFKKKTSEFSQTLLVELGIVACFASLCINAGSYLIAFYITLISKVFDKLHISGLPNYLDNLDMQVGLKDWLSVIVVGLALVLICVGERSKLERALVVVTLIGLFIMAMLYPIRAVNRAADYFYCFIMPIISVKRFGNSRSVAATYYNLVLPVSFLIMQMAYTL